MKTIKKVKPTLGLKKTQEYKKKLKIKRNLPPLPEATWTLTFDNDSTVFIAARDEAHARRIVENNNGFSRWRRRDDEEWQKRTIKKIEIN